MAKPWKVALSVQDGKGSKRSHTFYYAGDIAYATLETYIATYAARLAELLEGAIVKCSISREVLLAGLPDDPYDQADAEEKLRCTYRTAGYHKYTHTIPTYKSFYLLPPSSFDGLRKPSFDPEVNAFFNLLIAAVDQGFPQNPVDGRGEELDIILKRYQVFKKSPGG